MPIARLQTGAGDVAGVCPPPQLAGENRLATPVECADDKAYEANYVRGGRDGEVGERGGGRRGKGTGRKREEEGGRGRKREEEGGRGRKREEEGGRGRRSDKNTPGFQRVRRFGCGGECVLRL